MTTISPDPIPFHALTPDDLPVVERYRPVNPYLTCDYTFSNLLGWSGVYRTELAEHKGALLIRFWNEENQRHAYLMPLLTEGGAPLRELLLDLEEDQRRLEGKDLTLMGITPEAVEELREVHPAEMADLQNRDYSDYIYLREKLATLSGKKLQSKRNHCHRFERLYPDWCYEVITDESAADCLAVEERWYREAERADGADDERAMIKYFLTHFTEVGLSGGLIRVGVKVIAFTLGMPQSSRCFDINVEKADAAYEGSFAMINREFAARIPEQYTYVNREEDLGLEGLRRSKLSYKPELLVEKHTIVMIL